MKQITIQGAILTAIIVICISAIAIALITRDDCSVVERPEISAFDQPPPPRGPHGDYNRGQAYGDREFGRREMGPPSRQAGRRNNRRGGPAPEQRER